jgi:hypothetical protein
VFWWLLIPVSVVGIIGVMVMVQLYMDKKAKEKERKEWAREMEEMHRRQQQGSAGVVFDQNFDNVRYDPQFRGMPGQGPQQFDAQGRPIVVDPSTTYDPNQRW